MLLQGFFFARNLYGWTAWVRARDDSGIPVGWLSARARRLWGSATVAAWAMWSAAMHRLTDAAAPWIDGAIAMLSLTAQGLLAWRRGESWWLLILVDLIAVPHSPWPGLYATSAVYVLRLRLSLHGLIQWPPPAAAG